MNNFDDIPGTYLFDKDRCHEGYHFNMFCKSLTEPKNRDDFKANEEGYLDNWQLTQSQRQSVLDRDWLGMIKAGGNIYYTSKIAATDGHSFQYIAALMSGTTENEYRKMMVDGGRSIEGNRSLSEKG